MNIQIAELVNNTRPAFLSKQISKDINFDAEAGFAIQALSTSYAIKVALGNPQAVIDAVTNLAAIGLSLNPAKKQAYLVPRGGKICLDVSYMGLIDLVVDTGSILWAQCLVVYSDDDFALQGFDKAPHHKFNPFSKERGEIVGAYACVKTPTGDYLTHAMPISDIYAIRERSQSWIADGATPWKSDVVEMIKKTVIKQAYKYWPKTSPQLDNAIHYLNTETNEGLADISTPRRQSGQAAAKAARGAPENTDARDSLIADLEIIAKEQGITAYADLWAKLTPSQRKMVGTVEHTRLKDIASSIESTATEVGANG